MQKRIDSLWSQIKESYEAQACVQDKETARWQGWANYHSVCAHMQEQKIHDLESEISELENQQPNPYEKEVQQVSAVEDQTNRRMLAEGESVSSEQFRKQDNAERISQLEIKLCSARLWKDADKVDMLECEVEVCRSKKKALEIRNKASAIQKRANPFLQIVQLYYATQAYKCDEKAFPFENRENKLRCEILNTEADVRASDCYTLEKCLEDPQPAPSWQEIVNPLRGNILAGSESPSEWADRKRVRQPEKRLLIPKLTDELFECETQARHWREKADQFRNKASALISSEPTSDIELPERSERSALLGSGKRNNYQAIEPSTI
jgi:hypothetical protein